MNTWHAFSLKKRRRVTVGGGGFWQLVCYDSAVKSYCISVIRSWFTVPFVLQARKLIIVYLLCAERLIYTEDFLQLLLLNYEYCCQTFWCVCLMAFLYVVDSFPAFYAILTTLPLSFCYPDMKNLKLFSQLLIIIWLFFLVVHSENKQHYKI
jgi:hypothetical protein